MRPQYKILAEVYSSVVENKPKNDKEDILAGLEVLSEEDPYKLAQDIYNYCVKQKYAFKYTKHPEKYVDRVSIFVSDIFTRLNIPEVGWPTQRERVWSHLMDSISRFKTPEQQEASKLQIAKCIEKGLQDRERYASLQIPFLENDKDDIMAGLDKIIQHREIQKQHITGLTNNALKAMKELEDALAGLLIEYGDDLDAVKEILGKNGVQSNHFEDSAFNIKYMENDIYGQH